MAVFDGNFIEHNRKMEALPRKGFKPNTQKGYNTSVAHLTSYLEKSHGETDIDIRRIDHAFITGYEFFLQPRCPLWPPNTESWKMQPTSFESH